MKRKYLYVFMACMTIAMGIVFSGCGSAGSTKDAEATPSTENAGDTSQMTMGTIQSVDLDNNTVTLSVMQGFTGFDSSNFAGKAPDNFDPSNFEGKAPDNFDPSDFEGKAPDNFDPSDFKDQIPDAPDGQMPDGAEKPAQSPDGDRSFSESKTYTVTDQTVIKNQDGNTISLSELNENAFVQFTTEGDTITSITVTAGRK